MDTTTEAPLIEPGPCAKRRVVARLVLHNGLVIEGTNDCFNPQATCPREPGEGYEKCKSICQQVGHAETVAIDTAEALGASVAGSHLYFHGHDYACPDCQKYAYDRGVISIHRETHIDQ